MSWIKIQNGLINNKKTCRLAREMGWTRHQAIGFLVDFWVWAGENCDDGQLNDITDEDICFATGIPEAEGIIKAMCAVKLVDREPALRIHQWYEHQRERLKSKYKRHPEKLKSIAAFYNEEDESVQNCSGHVRDKTGTVPDKKERKKERKKRYAAKCGVGCGFGAQGLGKAGIGLKAGDISLRQSRYA